MPLADAWGATIDRTVTGTITLTLDVVGLGPVTVTLPFDEAKPVIAGAYARHMLANTIAAKLDSSFPRIQVRLWNARNQYARFVWKILAYQDMWDAHEAIRARLPGNQRAAYKAANMDPIQAKLDRFPAYRDRYAADAGEV